MSEQLNLDEIRARCEAVCDKTTGANYGTEEWARFCACAKRDVPALLSLIDRLTARVAELEDEDEVCDGTGHILSKRELLRRINDLRAQVGALTAERDEALVDAVPTRRLRQAIESLDGSALWLSQKDFIAALLDSPRAEPAEPRAEVAEPCYFWRDGKAWGRCAMAGAEPKAEPAPAEREAQDDGWLAECEREWARAYPASWQNKWGDRLIAAAKERDELRAKLGAPVDPHTVIEIDAFNRVVAERDELRARVKALTKKRDDASPRHKRAKGPRSKPNELRARIMDEAVLVAKMWNEVNGECSMAYRLDGMTAWGYAYCSKEDTFDWLTGLHLARRRALEALEDGLRQRMMMGTSSSYSHGELRSMEMDLPLWSWSDDEKAGKTP